MTSFTALLGAPSGTGLATIGLSDPAIDVLGKFETGDHLLGAVVDHVPNVAIVDARIAARDVYAVAADIRRLAPAVAVIVVAPIDDEAAYRTIAVGAMSLVIEPFEPEVLVDVVRSATRGSSVLPAQAARRLIHDIDSWTTLNADPHNPPPSLTAAERNVLKCMAAGLAPAEISQRYDVNAALVQRLLGFPVAKLHRYVRTEQHRLAAESVGPAL